MYEDGYIGDEHNGAFIINNGQNECLYVIASDGAGWEHVSVTVGKKNGALIKRCPTFDEMQTVKEKVFDEEETVFCLHPRKEDYIDEHPYCLHMWKPADYNIIFPPFESINDEQLVENASFEHEGIVVKIKTAEISGWKVARVYCTTKDGKIIKKGPSWNIMCQAKDLMFGQNEAAFQFIKSTNATKRVSLDIWYPQDLSLMPPLPDSILVGAKKKYSKKR